MHAGEPSHTQARHGPAADPPQEAPSSASGATSHTHNARVKRIKRVLMTISLKAHFCCSPQHVLYASGPVKAMVAISQFCGSYQVHVSKRCLTQKIGQYYARQRHACVAAQAFRHLYRYGNEEEKLALLAEILDTVKARRCHHTPASKIPFQLQTSSTAITVPLNQSDPFLSRASRHYSDRAPYSSATGYATGRWLSTSGIRYILDDGKQCVLD